MIPRLDCTTYKVVTTVKKVQSASDMKKESNDLYSDLYTHAENIVGIGTKGSQHKLKPLIAEDLMGNKDEYISGAKNVYTKMTLTADKNITGKNWS